MIFQSKQIAAQWDTWCTYHDGTFYLYYLITEHSPGEGFGVATSSDGVNWCDHGWAIGASDKMKNYLGTGSVWRDPVNPGRFICNYSEHREDSDGKPRQCILFAWSEDLIHWNTFGDDHIFEIDERWYERYGRWDCICAIPRREGGYWGTWTATPAGRETLNWGIGFGYSEDGLRWQAMTPGEVIPDAMESGAMVEIANSIHAMFGRNGEMVAYRADGVSGSFREATTSPALLSARHSYFSRVFRTPDDILVNHHVMDGRRLENGRPITYAAPFKRLAIDEHGVQRWYWWPGNEALKGLKLEPGSTVGLAQGLVAEVALQVAEDAPGEIILLVDGDPYQISVWPDGRARFTSETAPEPWQREHAVDRKLPMEQELFCRLLVRAGMLELYTNDVFMECWTLGCPEARSARLETRGSVELFEMRTRHARYRNQ